MKRLLRSRVFWAFALPATAAPFLVGRLVEEHFYTCRCGSGRVESWPRFGRWQDVSVRIGGSALRERPSELYTDLLQDIHTHAWNLEMSFIRPPGGQAASCGYRRGFDEVCRESSAFMDWLRHQCRSGAMKPLDIEKEILSGTEYPEDRFPFGWTPP